MQTIDEQGWRVAGLVLGRVSEVVREAAELESLLPSAALALDLNRLAREASDVACDALLAQTDLEAEQRRLYVALHEKLMQSGMSKTAANDAVLCDAQYIEHRQRVNQMGAAAQRAEGVYRVILQRANLIARMLKGETT